MSKLLEHFLHFSKYPAPNLNIGFSTYIKSNPPLISEESATKTLGETNLDVQNPLPLGGPNRTNSYNVPTGLYESNRSTNIFNSSTNYDVSVLREINNKVKKFQLHKYTPTNEYLLSKDWEDKFNQY